MTKKAAAKNRLATATPCDCGSWPHDFLTPCAFLTWCGTMRTAGYCSECGYELQRRLRWDEHMGCVVRQSRCPKGCSNSHEWIRAEDATQAERDELGLVLSEQR